MRRGRPSLRRGRLGSRRGRLPSGSGPLCQHALPRGRCLLPLLHPSSLPQGLLGCHALQHLDASDNRLDHLPARLHLPLLQHLSLASNALAVWPVLPPVPHLVRLSLGDVPTTSDLDDQFDRITTALERLAARLDELEASRVRPD